jgi:hypothetical protein
MSEMWFWDGFSHLGIVIKLVFSVLRCYRDCFEVAEMDINFHFLTRWAWFYWEWITHTSNIYQKRQERFPSLPAYRISHKRHVNYVCTKGFVMMLHNWTHRPIVHLWHHTQKIRVPFCGPVYSIYSVCLEDSLYMLFVWSKAIGQRSPPSDYIPARSVASRKSMRTITRPECWHFMDHLDLRAFRQIIPKGRIDYITLLLLRLCNEFDSFFRNCAMNRTLGMSSYLRIF